MATLLKERLVALLLQKKILSPEKLEQALKIHNEKKEKIEDCLVRLGYVSRENLLEVMSAELGIPTIHLSRYKIDPAVLSLVPRKLAEHYCLIPISSSGKTLTVAVENPTNVNAVDDLQRLTGLQVRVVLCSRKEICEAIEHYYGENATQEIQNVIENLDEGDKIQVSEDSPGGFETGSAEELLRQPGEAV